jgi:hypothetical protein
MTMVWQVPVAGGPLASIPCIQIVEVVIMAEAARVSGHHENMLWGKIDADAQGPTKGKGHNCPPFLPRVLGDRWVGSGR